MAPAAVPQLRLERLAQRAERIYRSLASPGEHRPAVLESLADLFLQQHRLDECIQTLRALVDEQPHNLHYTAKLANLLDELRQTQAAVEAYENLLERNPDLPVAHFNVALLYRKQKRYREALAAYEEAIRLDIPQPEEAYLNMGILYSEMQQEENARRMYDRALEIAPDYVPALYNRAGHFEGNRGCARDCGWRSSFFQQASGELRAWCYD